MSSLQIFVHFPATSGRTLQPSKKTTCRSPGFFLCKTGTIVFRGTLYRNLWISSERRSLFHEAGIVNRKQRFVMRANRGFGFNGGGGGGGGNNDNTRVVGNLVLAILLTYITMTGNLQWVLDAVVSFWIIVVVLPILGIGAFFWFAGRDILQGSCPNCGNDFQIFKSSLKAGPQLCPYCSEPFSVQDDQFVREPMEFSNRRPENFRQAFKGFAPWGSSQKDPPRSSSTPGTIVEIEAEVKDVD